MEIAFAIEPGPRQRQRIDSIRERAITYFSKPNYNVTFDDYPRHICLEAGGPELEVHRRLTERVVGDMPQYAFVPVWNCAKRLTFADSG
jgi:hypothetical protein